MKVFDQDKKKEQREFENCELLDKRQMRRDFDFCDENCEQTNQDQVDFLFRQPKRIKRTTVNELILRRQFGLHNVSEKNDFNEKYRAKCFAEMQKYKERIGRFN